MGDGAWTRTGGDTGWTATVDMVETIVLDTDWGETIPPPIDPGSVDPATFDPTAYIVGRHRSGKIAYYYADPDAS